MWKSNSKLRSIALTAAIMTFIKRLSKMVAGASGVLVARGRWMHISLGSVLSVVIEMSGKSQLEEAIGGTGARNANGLRNLSQFRDVLLSAKKYIILDFPIC
jgi:hypothetical protein